MPRAIISANALASLLVAAITATASAAPSGALVQVAPQAFESKQPLLHAKFSGAVAFYPSCTGDSGMVSVPTLILIGGKDDWAWAHACREMVENADKTGAPIKLVVYPDATHDFDVPATVPYQILGHHMAYDPAATQHAEKQVREFLRDVLQRPNSEAATPSVK
jgi:dienelactone hydrolase